MKRTALHMIVLTVVALVIGCSGSSSPSAPTQTVDNNAPIITRFGDAEVKVVLGDAYEDAGAAASDDVDGSLTANIVVGGDTIDTSVEGTYTITYDVTDATGNAAAQVTRAVTVVGEWPTSTPEAQDMVSATLNQVMDFVEQNSLDIESVIVIRHGHIVLEEYPDPKYDRDTLHITNSVTKSFVSALIGIAIQQGHLAGVDQKMINLFPDRTIHNVDMDGKKERITLENILTMTAGLEWSEWAFPYTSCNNDYVDALWCQPDPVQYILDLPMAEEPGIDWEYNGGTSHLLSALIASFSDTSDTLDFAREFLFEPMGITESDWEYDGNDIIRQGGGGLSLRPRDMAKFGYLYLHTGIWEGEQIVPADFVAEAVKTHSYPWGGTSFGYGYQSWWTYPEYGVYFADGLNGQKIYVVPDLDLVVVFTAHITENPGEWQETMLFDYIMAACDP
jgi:CubicO group peptidase (beta-lactamase class C family)